MATSLTTKAFWAGVGERALKTFAQSLLAGLGIGAGLLHVDWVTVLDVAAGATLISVLTSLATATTVTATSPLHIIQMPGSLKFPSPPIPPQSGPTAQS